MFKNLLKLSVLVFALTTLASAQFSMSVYVSIWTDGTNVWGADTQTYSPGSGCTMCESAYHSYSASVSLTGPSGTGTNTCSGGDPASVAYTLNCEASIPDTFLSSGANSAVNTLTSTNADDCSMIGEFMDNEISISSTEYRSSYQTTGPSPLNPAYCVWTNYVVPGNGCPGVSSVSPHTTLGCGAEAIKACIDIYNSSTGWDYRVYCLPVGPPEGFPTGIATCSTKF